MNASMTWKHITRRNNNKCHLLRLLFCRTPTFCITARNGRLEEEKKREMPLTHEKHSICTQKQLAHTI